MLKFRSSSWHSLLKPDQAANVATVAHEVAACLREQKQVENALAAAPQQTAFPKSVHWRPYGIAQGNAGLAVLSSYLDSCFPQECWDVIGHQHLEVAAQAAEAQVNVPIGLFSGLSGLAFAAWCLSKGGVRYRKLLAVIEEILLSQTIALAESLHHQKNGLGVHQFDLISGLTGVGAYLLCRREEPRPAAALQAVLHSLVKLTTEEAELPCWHTPPHLMFDETMARLYPNGNLNCGLAHGIPGPLALMALAQRSGVPIEGITDAIERVASWLLQNRLDDSWGVNWPTAVPLRPASAPAVFETGTDCSQPSFAAVSPSRTAWCYGSPGVARSLWLAGEALNCSEYRELAIAAMEGVYRKPLAARQIDSPTFCHGVAGLLQITLRFAHDTGLPIFTNNAMTLSEQLLSRYEPKSLLGYRSLEPGDRAVDQPGLLDGASGVALVLLAAATDIEPTWDRLFLLS